jgi:O-antigen/teichoic acid export membrane protein
MVPTSVAGAAFPRFASGARGDAERLQVDVVAILLAVMAPITIGVIAFIGPFLYIWIGPKLAASTTAIAHILIFGLWINSTALVPYSYLQAIGRPDLPTKVHLAYLVPYCVLLYFGVTHLGALGAAMVWSLRTCFDPVLFILSGTAARVLPMIVPPTLLVLAATGAALALPWNGWPHWLAMAGLLLLSARFALRTVPAAAWSRAGWIRARLPRPLQTVLEAAVAASDAERSRRPDARAEL